MKNFMKRIVAHVIVLCSIVAVSGSLSFAQTASSTATSTKPVTLTCVGAGGSKCTKAEQKIFDDRTKAMKEIDRRVEALGKLQDRIHDMRNISDTQKTTLIATIQSQIGTLTILKNQIAGEIDTANLKTEIDSITKGQRIYALVMPQISLMAASDRITSIISMMNTLGAKIQTRLAVDTTTANMTSIKTALADFTNKIADAQALVQAANTEIVGLTPDGGDKDKFTANETALKDARKKIQTARADLVAARKDAQNIIKALQGNTQKMLKNATSTRATQ